ncbi:MAG: secretion protein HlyD [Moraxellaceae bacterium]|nr:MAG: secretion protein HlyD [Moraxellaceae bacterium]
MQKATISQHPPLLSLIGQLESPRVTTLSAPSNAYVQEVLTAEGLLVKQGDLLALLDPNDETLRLAQKQADIADLQAQISTEKSRYRSDIQALEIEAELAELANKASNRYGKLAQQQVGTDVQWDESKQAAGKQSLSLLIRELDIKNHPNRLARLQAQLTKVTALRDQSLLDLSRTRISAPFNARVTQVLISPQNRLRAGDPIITLYDTDAIELRAQIPLKYLPIFELALQQDTPIKGHFQSMGHTIPITLARLSGAIAKGQGGIDGLFNIESNSLSTTPLPFAIGRSLTIALLLPVLQNSFAVPSQAIYGQDKMYTVHDSILQSHRIHRLGSTTLGDGAPAFLIRSDDIAEGSDILITQVPNAISGMKVQIIEPAAQIISQAKQ